MNCHKLPGFLLILLVLISCNRNSGRHHVDVGKITIENVRIIRYEKALFSIDPSDMKSELTKLQSIFPMFLDGDLNDSSNLKRISDYVNDTMLVAVYNDCLNLYSELSNIESELTEAFRHYKYYYPDRNLPEVYSYVSGFDFGYPVQYFSEHLLIALDMYLGPDYPRYMKLGLANYIIRRFSSEYMVRDCILAMSQPEISYRDIGSSLLDMMITEGKKLWFTKAMLPRLPGTILFNYSEQQWQWAVKTEPIIWAFLIENEMLFKSDIQPIQKFISEGPFTSYFGAESPPRLGSFIGWRIVSSYMNRHPKISVDELMKNNNAQEILNQSGYKPRLK